MKQLFLLRHGEATFSSGSDFQRTLTDPGREKVYRLGKTLKEMNVSIDYLFCSEAKRTLETAQQIKKSIQIDAEEITRKIYEGDVKKLIDLLEQTPQDVENCLLIGHNPTISLLLSNITGASYFSLDPGMMAIIELEISNWKAIGMGTGSLREILE